MSTREIFGFQGTLKDWFAWLNELLKLIYFFKGGVKNKGAATDQEKVSSFV